jgi:hypothetical protein
LSAGVARNPPNSRANYNAENTLPVIGDYSPIERKAYNMKSSVQSGLASMGTVLILLALANPAFAATYWVVVGATPTHQCLIVEQDQKPAGKVIGNGYSTEELAQSTIQHAIACGGVH